MVRGDDSLLARVATPVGKPREQRVPQETVSVFITFNSDTDRNADSHVKDVGVAAGTRVLFE